MTDDLRRLETLERLVRHLTLEVAALRAELRARDGQARAGADGADGAASAPMVEVREAPPHAQPPAYPAHERRDPFRPRDEAVAGAVAGDVRAARRRLAGPRDVERLVGRYGTVALAVLTIVMGLGVFLRWAVEHVEVGPGQRVAMGAAGALAVGAFGWRLRARGARQYGNMLVGLSLALVHVVAWGAGPYLRVVPDAVALTVAAAASVLLAALAWHEREEPLFAAGLGGAFLAPFVTTRGGSSPEALLLYAAALVVPGTLALRRGDWRLARRILAMGTLLFAGAALAILPDGALWWRLAEAPAFALGAALVAQLGAGEWHRRALAYAHLASALVVCVALMSSLPPLEVAAGLGLAGAALAALASRGEGDAAGGTLELGLSSTGTFTVGAPTTEPVPWVGAVGFPLAFMGVALASLLEPVGLAGSLVAAAFALPALAFAVRSWREGPARRGAHLVAAGVAVVLALLLGVQARPVLLAIALAAAGAAGSAAAARTATPLVLVPSLLALALATVTAMVELGRRAAWGYVPFATAASLAALAAAAAWWVAARETAALACARGDATADIPRRRGADEGAVLRGIAYVVAFAWGHEELRRAVSPALATFLLVAYYATTGVVTIGIGRARGSATARRVGLGLAVLAALTAIARASAITSIGMRVGSYLLVGGFLLGVAWWYRSGGAEDADEPAEEAPRGVPGGELPLGDAQPAREPAGPRG